MKIVGEIELSGVKRIVINRMSVWERKDLPASTGIPFAWRKIAGGPGFLGSVDGPCNGSEVKKPGEVSAMVNRLLAMGTIEKTTIATKKGALQSNVSQSLAYRCWVHGDTLNIVRKDLP